MVYYVCLSVCLSVRHPDTDPDWLTSLTVPWCKVPDQSQLLGLIKHEVKTHVTPSVRILSLCAVAPPPEQTLDNIYGAKIFRRRHAPQERTVAVLELHTKGQRLQADDPPARPNSQSPHLCPPTLPPSIIINISDQTQKKRNCVFAQARCCSSKGTTFFGLCVCVSMYACIDIDHHASALPCPNESGA